MKLFNLDSPLMQFLNKLADLMWLNILAMVCCIPVVTAGASMTALNYMALKIVRGEECYITRGFFKSFKQNFKQATLIWLLLLLAYLILIGDFYIMKNSGIEFHQVMKIIIGAAGILLVCTTVFVFPALAKFDNTIGRTLKNALMMSILQLPKTVLMIILYAAPILLAMLVPQVVPISFLFGLSGPCALSAMLYNKFFKKLEAQIEAANAPEEAGEGENGEEDERIFKDELDESLLAENAEQK